MRNSSQNLYPARINAYGFSDKEDAYMYVKVRKDGTELSYIEAILTKTVSSVESLVVQYSPKITIKDGVYSGHMAGAQIIKMPNSGNTFYGVARCDGYLYRDPDFLGIAFVQGLRGNTMETIPNGTDALLTMSKENIKNLIDTYISVEGANASNNLNGSFIYYRKNNDYQFESSLRFFEEKSASVFYNEAKRLNKKWQLQF